MKWLSTLNYLHLNPWDTSLITLSSFFILLSLLFNHFADHYIIWETTGKPFKFNFHFVLLSFRLSVRVVGCCRFPGAYWGQIQFTQWAPCMSCQFIAGPLLMAVAAISNFGVQYLAQGYFDMYLSSAQGSQDSICDLLIPSPPALPTELQPP